MWRSHVQRVASWIINILGWTLLTWSIFCPWSEMYNRRKLEIQKFHQVFFPTYQELPSLEICTRSCDKIFQHNCQKNSFDTARYEISLGRRSKTGVTPSSRVLCGVNDHLLVREFDELCKGAKVLWMLCSQNRVNSTKKRQQRRMTKKGMMMLEKIA